jgi:predicted dehydrogenase/sugar phosphate isomerase/epimerase
VIRVALIEASHWHTPLYLDALERPDVQVVGVSDGERVKGRDIAARFDCPIYDSYEELLQQETIDFAFAFGRHAEMARIAEMLIERRIPFALEKPCGTNAAQVARLRQLAEAAGVYVAVPFIFRISDFLAAIGEMEGRIPSDFNHLQFRFIVGPPSRYLAGAPWMLDPTIAGGGSTINVATHFVDLFRFITGKEVATVSAVMSFRTHRGEIEDYSIVTLQTDDGVIGVVESGYSFPSTSDEQREFSFTLGSSSHYAYSGRDAVHFRDRANIATGTRTRPVRLETDVYYPAFVTRVLAEFRAGSSPVAGLRDAEAMMEIIDAAYASARQGGAPQKMTRKPQNKPSTGNLTAGDNARARGETPATAAYTVNTYPYTQRYGLRDCIAHLADLGFRSFEPMLVPGHFWPSSEAADERRKIGSLLARRDLRIVTINQPNLDINLGSGVPEMREHSCAMMIAAMQLAGDWGAMGIVVNPGKANPVLPSPGDQITDWFRRSLDILVPEAERLNVQLIVKNHPLSYLYRAAELASFFDGYGWERIGIGYDFANGHFGREDPKEALKILNSRIEIVYAADSGLDEFRHDPVGAGAVRFDDIAGALRAFGYRGDTVLEILNDEPDRALASSVAQLETHAWPRLAGS